ncbi:MAG: tellurite resistance TerB C-terminal domain-containing protein [Chitinophagaceae bacterium]
MQKKPSCSTADKTQIYFTPKDLKIKYFRGRRQTHASQKEMYSIKTIKTFFTLLLLAVTINLNAQNLYQTTSDSKLRSGPSVKYKSLGIIKNGGKVIVIKKLNSSWFKIEYNGKTGYLFSKFLIPIVEVPKVEEIPKIESEKEKSSSSLLYIIGAIIVVALIFIVSSNNKKKQTNSKIKIEKEQKEKLIGNILNKIKIEVSTSSSNNPYKDNSIIDVTGKSYRLNPINLKKYEPGVPHWAHQYVYSYSEINSATNEQINFYNLFKYHFLRGEYFDLEGNTNYAFILLFDLINGYENHKNLKQVERQLEELGLYYPKTKSYALPSLIKKLEQIGDSEAIAQLRNRQSGSFNYQQISSNSGYSFDSTYWGLGTKYKVKLNLQDEEVKLLNILIDTDNKFNSIEYCATGLIHMFLSAVNEIEEILKKENTNIQEQANAIAKIEIANHYRYTIGSYNYKSVYDIFINNIYQAIYKISENKLRDHFNVGRKTELNWYIRSEEAFSEFNNKFLVHVDNILDSQIRNLKPVNLESEILVNEYNKARWKYKIEELELKFKETNIEQYIQAIHELERANQTNSSVENIFFQASKFISKYNQIESLKFYLYYLFYDLKSSKFDNKQLTKTIQKSLFKTNEQLRDFEVIVSELIKDNDLEKALKAVPQFYTVKRKKIQLDKVSIKEVQQQHSGTVELLNEYLKDEYEDENTTIKAQEINSEEVKIEIIHKVETTKDSIYSSEIELTSIQLDALEIFSKNSFSISQSDFETFAKSKGVFKNQLIESINEICFSILDDVLIEEEEDNYIINENYYQRILAK